MARMHNPAHPGEVLRDYLPEGLAVTEAAGAWASRAKRCPGCSMAARA